MSKLNVYVVRDSLAGSNELILTAINDEILKRSVKGALLSQQQNFLNTDTKDKDIYHCAVLDTESGIITGVPVPSFVVNIEQLRIELVKEIQIKKAEAGILEEGDQHEEN